ncbi:polygalacturonase-like [Cylas formicarius]|uniref:polygalacturonase-like n=1 Tax=Cylas formicarius TaxID=197179 RepID=UPI0029589996|nr:polygalacturonase-like [Cylas formicarius]XP_060535048.1 polygalacturonase-like [Cylas formicarius]
MIATYVAILLLNLAILSQQQDCVLSKYEDVNSVTSNCTDIVVDDLIVPAGKTLRLNLQEGTRLTLKGNISFEFHYWSGPVILIAGSSLTVVGDPGSVLDGQGERYWDGQGSWGNYTKPKLMRIEAQNSVFAQLSLLNCPMACTAIKSSNNVTITNWNVDLAIGDEGIAPKDKFGHNTDGFQISGSSNITIQNSTIYNQDDCIVVNSGSNILLQNLFCHGSHGLSLSLGFANNSFAENSVDNVIVRNATLVNGENAIHIKTHTDAGNGLISNVIYEDIKFAGQTLYGINVQQNYVNTPANETVKPAPVGNIPIVNLTLSNIAGNVPAEAVPVYISCAEGACQNWNWDNVNVTGIESNDCNFEPVGYKC